MKDNTPTCSICNFTQHPLLCNRCISHAVLNYQIKIVSVTEKIYNLCKEINGIITDGGENSPNFSTGQLHDATVMECRRLQAQKSLLELEKVRCLDSIEGVKTEMRAVREQLAVKRRELEAKQADLKNLETASIVTSQKTVTTENSANSMAERNKDGAAVHVSAAMPSNGGNISSGDKDYQYINYKKIDLALRFLVKFNSLFLISIKRNSGNRRGNTSEREVFISFNPIPNLSNLVKYSHNILNASFERLSYYCFFSSNYLGLLLPYPICPPQRQQPMTVILGKNGAQFELKARDTIKKQIKERPKDFDDYAKGLSMLAIDLLFLCLYTGVVNQIEVNKTNTHTNNTTKKSLNYDSENMADKALNIDQNIYLLNIFFSNKSNHHHHYSRRQNPVHPLSTNKNNALELPDLEDVWDLVVNKNYIEVNGNSAEWNII